MSREEALYAMYAQICFVDVINLFSLDISVISFVRLNATQRMANAVGVRCHFEMESSVSVYSFYLRLSLSAHQQPLSLRNQSSLLGTNDQ